MVVYRTRKQLDLGALTVHVRACDISASWRLDNVIAAGKQQTPYFTSEWDVAPITFSSSACLYFIRIICGFALASRGSSFEETIFFRCAIASEGTVVVF